MKLFLKFGAITILLVPYFFFHAKSFNNNPIGPHTWAQTDHYAIALNYSEGAPFLAPQTYTLNLQFPANKKVDNPRGLTAIDFPIVHFFVGKAMILSHSTKPVVHRLITFFFSLCAIFTLFFTVLKYSNITSSLILTSLIAYQPIFVFYQNGFHISPTAFSVTTMGLCLFFIGIREKKNHWLYLSTILLTISASIRFTHSIFLIAQLLTFIITIKRPQRVWLTLTTISGIAVVLLLFVYNQHQADIYGSVFRNSPRLSTSMEEIANDLFLIFKTYAIGLMPIPSALIFSMLLVYSLKQKMINVLPNDLIVFFIFQLLGVVAFTALMLHSVAKHDYYSLDTWTPVIVFAILISIPEKLKKWQIAVTLLLLIYNAMNTTHTQHSKLALNKENLIMSDFEKSTPFLDSLIREPNRAVIMCTSGYNVPMIGWREKTFRCRKEKYVGHFINNEDIEWFIIHNRSSTDFSSLLANESNHKTSFISTNGIVSIWKRNRQPSIPH